MFKLEKGFVSCCKIDIGCKSLLWFKSAGEYMSNVKKIAIAEDDAIVARFLEENIAKAGYLTAVFNTGEALVKFLKRETADLVLLDWNLPGISGFEVLNWARENLSPAPPVIMLSARSEKLDIVECLGAGADDYIIKPEAANIIMARISAVLRRRFPETAEGRFLNFGIYEFDKLGSTVRYRDEYVALTSKEFALALMFFRNANRPISRTYILETVWNASADIATRTLDMHVSKIRAKLDLNVDSGFRISTIFGYGYRLETYTGEEHALAA
jgi:DNA-binding response OmpR family regulator